MVTTALAPTNGTIINLDMDAETAAQHTRRIQEHIEQAGHHLAKARSLLWEVREYNGFEKLGYKSWRAYALEEFGKCSSMCYKEANAAQVELDLGLSPIGTMHERALRPLAKAGYSAATRQALYGVALELVGDGGKVTSGVMEAVVTGLEEMLASGTTQDADGIQTPITTRMQADLLARVREKKIAHKEHVRRMDAKREYLCGGVPIERIFFYESVQVIVRIDDPIQHEKMLAAAKTGHPIYLSLWTESNEPPE